MDIFREEIDRMVYETKKMLEDYTREYKLICGADEEARLICCRNHGRNTYYSAHKENGKYVRKSIDSDQDAINTLARKEFLRIAVDALQNNIDVLEASRGKLSDTDFDAIRSRMYKACRELPEECFFDNGTGRIRKISEDNEDRFKRHRAWEKEPFEQSTYKPEGRRFMTSAGFKVRSKSEQHIVEQLVNYGVPFRYEQVIHIEEMSYSADFTFRDRNLDLFYWEHAGMMDMPSYVDSYYRKMDVFAGIGIVPWKNLIITYDIDGVINVPMIKSIIEHEVIPRL